MNLSQEITQFIEKSGTGWIGFGDILNAVGDKITAERASQIYTAEYADNEENASKDTEEKVRVGRRRMIARSLSQLVYYNNLECQDSTKKVHERMYKKGTGKSKTVLASSPEELLQLLKESQDSFEQLDPNSYEQQDFRFHVRSLRRIVICLNKKRSDG